MTDSRDLIQDELANVYGGNSNVPNATYEKAEVDERSDGHVFCLCRKGVELQYRSCTRVNGKLSHKYYCPECGTTYVKILVEKKWFKVVS